MYYDHHIFFCCNERPEGEKSCGNSGAGAIYKHAKDKVKSMALPEKVRVNKAGCMGRCDQGPSFVIYPEGLWYHYDTEADVDEILEAFFLRKETAQKFLI
jgi:(2Fe-2S) ferredoxin